MLFITVYIFLYIVSSEVWFQVADGQLKGTNPYPFGTTIFSLALHITILIVSVWYLGWIVGILLFLLHLLTFTHAIFGWILIIPSIIKSNSMQSQVFLTYLENQMMFRIAIFGVIVPMFFVFLVISFFLVEFRIVQNTSLWSFNTIIVLTILALFSYLIKFYIKSKYL